MNISRRVYKQQPQSVEGERESCAITYRNLTADDVEAKEGYCSLDSCVKKSVHESFTAEGWESVRYLFHVTSKSPPLTFIIS